MIECECCIGKGYVYSKDYEGNITGPHPCPCHDEPEKAPEPQTGCALGWSGGGA